MDAEEVWASGLNPPPAASGVGPLVNAPQGQPASDLGSHHGPYFPSAIPRSTLSAAQNRPGQSIPADGRISRHDVLGRRDLVAIEIFVDCHTRPSPCVSDFSPKEKQLSGSSTPRSKPGSRERLVEISPVGTLPVGSVPKGTLAKGHWAIASSARPVAHCRTLA